MSSTPKKPARKKTVRDDGGGTFQTTAQLHGTPSRSTNFSFKKDFVKDSMVVLGPERTFKLRNPLVQSPSSNSSGMLLDNHHHHQSQFNSNLLQAIEVSGGAAAAHHRPAGESPSPTTKHRNLERSPSVSRSYSLSSYDEIVRDASKHNGRRWPSNHCFCLMAALFCLGIGIAFGIYFGLINTNKEKLVDFVYRGSFRLVEGDRFVSNLSDSRSSAFTTKARDYQTKLDSIFRNSSLADIYHHAEIIAFDGREGHDLSVFFNLYCWTKKSLNSDAIELETLLKNGLSDELPVGVSVDRHSIEVRARSAIVVPAGSGNRTLSTEISSSGEGIERRSDIGSINHLDHDLQEDNNGRQNKGPSCQPVSLNFCRHQLAYNFTSWPNLLGHRNSRQVQRFNEAAKMLVESECSSNIQQVLCHILQPPCDPADFAGQAPPLFIPPPPKILPPCRSLCMAASSSCQSRLGLGNHPIRPDQLYGNKLLAANSNDMAVTLRDLLRCDLFPVDDGLGSCTADPAPNHVLEAEPSECVMFMTSNGQASRVCDGFMDCHDFSDEVACSYCPEGQVHCGVGAACIDVERRCDGIPDCPNGSDERGCLTVAPDMAAANFVHQYFHEGYIVFTEGNNTGKVCVDSLNATGTHLTAARRQSFLEVFGETACRSMSYRIMERIEIRTDNERSSDYAHLTEPIRWRATFLRAPCRKRQVLYLSCSGLECGTRPVHMHPDRPGSHLTLLPSAHGDWPWLAALIRDGVHACDATLVADQWLLTSATCFDGQNRAHWVARFAAVRLTSDAPWEQERRIIGMVKSPMKGNQLVLIKMESPVIYSDFVRPVCLARDHQAWIETPSSRCIYLGWGKDRDNLHEVSAKVVESPKCDNVTTLCADVLNPADSCRNDEFSGSPLLCQLSDGGSWSLVGVSSENRHCDRSFNDRKEFRIYLGVSSISDWVMQTVRR